jgi:hypothetical protein
LRRFDACIVAFFVFAASSRSLAALRRSFPIFSCSVAICFCRDYLSLFSRRIAFSYGLVDTSAPAHRPVIGHREGGMAPRGRRQGSSREGDDTHNAGRRTGAPGDRIGLGA